MSDPRWGFTKPGNWRLILCALGVHKFYFSAAHRDAERDTRRDCYVCGIVQTRRVMSVSEPGVDSFYLPWQDSL